MTVTKDSLHHISKESQHIHCDSDLKKSSAFYKHLHIHSESNPQKMLVIKES